MASMFYIELSRGESNRNSQEAVRKASLTNVKIDDFSLTGNLAFVLEATSLKQDASSGVSYLINPSLKLEDPPGTIWSIKSLNGSIFPKVIGSEQKIELSGEVLITRSTDLGQILLISSDDFIFVPKKQYGETLSPVTIKLGKNTTTAARLSIDLIRGELRLESNSTQNVISEIMEK